MPRTTRIAEALLIVLVILATQASPNMTRATDPVLNIGHRGASGYAPEHTFAAYDLARALGADYLEQDLQLTSDGVLVVLHDTTLNRTARGPAANCTGLVSDKTLAQIKTCDVGSWFNDARPTLARPEYVGLQIPTLEEVFQRYRRRVNYYIETKSPDTADHMEERLLALLAKYNLLKPAARRWRVLIQSFSAASLQIIHALDPTLPLIQLVLVFPPSPALETTLDTIAAYAVGIGPAAIGVTSTVVEAAHARCLDVHPYTVNQPIDMATLIATGVNGMFTNVPDQLDVELGKKTAYRSRRAAWRAAKARAACVETGGGTP
jgi:glycerophosphoryl diester phosphodiesterase